MNALKKGPSRVIGPEAGQSFWQPGPHHGHMTIKVGPGVENDADPGFAFGTQVLPPGCHVREHGHARNTEVLFIYEGTGSAALDGVAQRIGPGSTILLGQYVAHTITNDGDCDMKFAWSFTPSGLDEVIRAVGIPKAEGDETPPENFVRPENMSEILRAAGYATPEEIAAAERG